MIEVDTSVRLVTFFEDRAEVVRVAKVSVPAGRSRVHARGLTLLVDDRSLTCRGADVVFSRIRRRVFDAESAEALENERTLARDKVTACDRAIANAASESKRFGALLRQWAEAAASVPSRAEDAAKELARAYGELDGAVTKSIETFSRLRAEREDALEATRSAEERLAQARAKAPRVEAFVEIELVSEAARDLEIEIVYRTPCALWRPEHLVRLVRREEIVITTYATVWQCTGENWTDVEARFSTARPARSANAPPLQEDQLTTRKRAEKRVVVEARETSIAEITHGTRAVNEMPGVDDGGEAQLLTAQAPATIESDGRPVRIEIGERKMPCTVNRICYPERGPATHLRAKATMPGPIPLLAGPITVGRESEIVGRSTVGFIGAGEPFELGFGVDDGVRVRRKLVEKRKTTPVTGTQHVAREVFLYVSNLAGDARKVEIVERVPVSEVEDVVVEVQSPVDRDGFVTFNVDLAASATAEVVLRYNIEAASSVVLPA